MMKRFLLFFIFALVPLLSASTLVAQILPFGGGTINHGPVTVNNFVSSAQVMKLDRDGNSIDAHESGIFQYGSTFYLYGHSYNCGFRYGVVGTPFCGVNIYSSTDLVHWTNHGLAFDPAPYQTICNPEAEAACARPHIVYNASTAKFVLWLNSYKDPGSAYNYRVFTSSSPTGPYVEASVPTLGRPVGASVSCACNGDEELFVDNDGTGYIAYTVQSEGSKVYVERLTSDYLSGDGTYVAASETGVESPAIFKRGGTYYLTFGVACGFCPTSTKYRTASSPLGTWSASTIISSDSCAGQPRHVSTFMINREAVYLYQSDQWYGGGTSLVPSGWGYINQGRGNYFFKPLTFSGTAVDDIVCSNNFLLALDAEDAPVIANSDQIPGGNVNAVPFTSACDIDSSKIRIQSFTPSVDAKQVNFKLSTFKSSPTRCDAVSCVIPSDPLKLDLVTIDGSGAVVSTLAQAQIAVATIGYAPRFYATTFNVAVTANDATLAVKVYTDSAVGCYGFSYNDQNIYSRGHAYLNGTLQANRVLQFYTN